MCASAQQGQREASETLDWSEGSCELPDWVLGPDGGPLEKQKILLTHKPFLQPQIFKSKKVPVDTTLLIDP